MSVDKLEAMAREWWVERGPGTLACVNSPEDKMYLASLAALLCSVRESERERCARVAEHADLTGFAFTLRHPPDGDPRTEGGE